MENRQPLLSICIPTFNRAEFLEGSLKCFEEQLRDIDKSEIELYVSDNCSEDYTPQVVQLAIQRGLPIIYNRNGQNLGPDKNFLLCMQRASGKYIWLLGDDDLLRPNTVKYILDLLRNHDYGLIHLSVLSNENNLPEIQEYDNLENFFKTVSFWITFMSGSIFLKESVSQVKSHEKYIASYLLQVPFYIMSASLRKKNLFVRESVMQNGLDASSNGGYNFYQVFVENYLSNWKEYVDKGIVSEKCYIFIKKDIYVNFIDKFNWMLLIRRKNVSSEKLSCIGNRKGFKVKDAWSILFKYYGNEVYFYISFIKYPYWLVKKIIRKILK